MLLMDLMIIWGVAIVLFLLLAIPFIGKKRELEKHTEKADQRAHDYGLKEPVSLHPIVNPDICIGSAGCIAACPEQDVLGLRNGQAVPVSPAHCIGHGLCERSCPVDAITLVFGSEKRGVEIPRIKENFETNVDGIYIVGELGGMGLIRNCFEQGRQCIEYISEEKRETNPDALDAVIVGCGPAGLSATIYGKTHDLNIKTIEREDIGGTVRYYPRKKLVMTQPLKIPGYGSIHRSEISKEELMELWSDIVEKLDLSIQTGETVAKILQNEDDTLTVKTNKGRYLTNRVVLAIGRRGTPRKLNIPGEELPNVAYSIREPDQFSQNKMTVVGGGDSAIEAALALKDQPGNTVRVSYRREHFHRIKPVNQQKINKAVEQGEIEVLWSTNVIENHPDHIVLKKDNGEEFTLENDYLFIFAGGVLPTPFLKKVGIKIDTKFGEPVR